MGKQDSRRLRGARKTSGHNWTPKNIMRQQPKKRKSTTNNLLSQSEKQKALKVLAMFESLDKINHDKKADITNLDQLTTEPIVRKQLNDHRTAYNAFQLEKQRIKEKNWRQREREQQQQQQQNVYEDENMFDVPVNQNNAWEDEQLFEGDLNSGSNRKSGGKTKKRKFRGKKSKKNRY